MNSRNDFEKGGEIMEGYIIVLAIGFVAGALVVGRKLTGKWFVFKK
jgi:hypothetical protein